MRVIVPALLGSFALVACANQPPPQAAAPAAAPAPAPMVHTIIPAKDVKWGPGPASYPPGAQMTVLYGDPGKTESFGLRLKLPKGYAIPPHMHPNFENVTVISGTFRVGMGETANRAATQALPAGSFFTFSPGMAHFAFADTDTVVQLNSIGPAGIKYVNPADDPRNKK